MKRKSILMTIVAVLFASFAMAQNPWPPATTTFPTTDKVQGSDTIFFCATLDSLYPIELGYDVAKRDLRPSYGTWKLYSITPGASTPSDYSFSGNGGAGNALKLVGSSVGGYLFKYTSADSLCGLDPNESYFLYVFILPDTETAPIKKEASFCPKAIGDSVIIKKDSLFKEYLDVYAYAGFTKAWKKSTESQWKAALHPDGYTKIFVDTLMLTPPSSKKLYTCGTKLGAEYVHKVRNRDKVPALSVAICPDDTIRTGGGLNKTNYHFERDLGGYYAGDDSIVNNATSGALSAWATHPSIKINGVFVKYRLYEYKYKKCNNNDTIVKDTLILYPGSPPNQFWGYDTVRVCRTPGKIDYDLFDVNPELNGKPTLTSTKVDWTEYGSVKRPPWTLAWAEAHGYDANYYNNPGAKYNAYMLDLAKLASNVGYHYQWHMDPAADCFGNDTGRVVLIFSDPVVAKDLRAQVCETNAPATFSLAAFSSIQGATWYKVNSDGTKTNIGIGDVSINLAALTKGTHTYYYDTPAGCGAETGAKFYLRKNEYMKINSTYTVKFCSNRLPASINLFEVIGAIPNGAATWSGPSNPGFDTNTGIIDVAAFGVVNNTYTFVLPSTGLSCINKTVTVNVVFTDTIL